MLDALGSPRSIVSASTKQLQALDTPPAAIAHLRAGGSDAQRHALAWLEHPNHRLLSMHEAAFPDRLRELPQAPVALFCQGDTELLKLPQLAIVGSRNPTPAGLRHARLFARSLSTHGLVITSGLAQGIDAAAHSGALESSGLTIAVTGCGLDRVYPASNGPLAKQIAAQGLLISEFVPGTAPQRSHFPRRNRLISGLSLGTLVIEATPRSGSLITARFASEQGREVFALPGSVDNPLARGCHQLIRNGAKLVETAADILEELAPIIDNVSLEPAETASTSSQVHDEEYQHLLKHLDNAPMSIDALAAATGLSVNSVSSMLLILELQGAVAQAPGGGYQRG